MFNNEEEKELRKEFDKSFKKNIENLLERKLKGQRDKETWIVKYNGEQVCLSSGKQVWSSIGAAKNALANEFCGDVCDTTVEGINWWDKDKREFLRNYLYSKFEFVRLS